MWYAFCMNFPSLKNLHVVKDNLFILTLFNVLLFVAPGTAIISFFYPDFFQSLDWVRLILISVSIMAPLVIVNTFIMVPYGREKDNEENLLFASFFVANMFSALLLYMVIAVNYFWGRTLREGLIVIGVVEVALLFGAFLHIRFRKK